VIPTNATASRRAPTGAGALVLACLAAPALAESEPASVRPPAFEEAPPAQLGSTFPADALVHPRLTLDIDMNLYGIATPSASASRREGFAGFLFGHINPGLHLTPDVSVQAFIHPDSAGDFEPNGAVAFLRRQNVILEQLFAEWRPTKSVQFYAGKFNAPFGYGYEFFPGVLASFRAHDVYLIREQLGAGANWTLPLPEGWGEHTVSAAVFTLDTSLLANSLVTRQRCCDPGFNRYVRTTLRQGGAGNTGNLDNVAFSVEGHEIPTLPGLTYNLGLLSRGGGKDGTRREWAWAAGLRYEHAWTRTVRSLVFGETVEFRNAGGNPLEAAEDGTERVLSEQRRFSTLGTQTLIGPWRATFVWQREEAKRSFNASPAQTWLEISGGRELGWGFGLDIGYQYARYVQDDRSLGQSHSIVGRLNYRFID
jgi:hypothetical protein